MMQGVLKQFLKCGQKNTLWKKFVAKSLILGKQKLVFEQHIPWVPTYQINNTKQKVSIKTIIYNITKHIFITFHFYNEWEIDTD